MEKITHENWPESWRDIPPFTEISEEIYEELLVCPCCGETSIFPAYRCDLCGEWITGEYVKTLDGDRICGECYTHHDAGEY